MHHHALLFIGSREAVFPAIPSAYQKADVDTHHISCDRFGINDARTLKEMSETKPVSSDARRFVITTEEILREAQHALLKLFEDPPATARFLVILPHERHIISTLRSRFHVVLQDSEDIADDVFTAFQRLSYDKRLAEVGMRLQKKDTLWTESLLRGVEKHADRGATTHPELLKDVLRVRLYMHARGASQKMLLEHLALAL